MVLNTGLKASATSLPSITNPYIDLMARVEEKIAADLTAYLPSQIGIVLMNHGCPHKAKASRLVLQKVRRSTTKYGSADQPLSPHLGGLAQP